jgi:protein-L-isoaspartate(D-aspartate) O-methyltransferase
MLPVVVWLVAMLMLACSAPAATSGTPLTAVAPAIPAAVISGTSWASPASPAPTSTDSVVPTSTTAFPGASSPLPTPDPYLNARLRMVQTQMQARDITDPRVLAVMEKVPRHEFVTPDTLDQAYYDFPLPIGFGQTISQPYIVALMTQLVALKAGDKVLEIGTGSGYQAAVLAELSDRVCTIEIIPQLAQRARATLDRLGYQKVVSKQGDGYDGWPEQAPFDAIIVTAAPDHVPQPLLRQLADGGRMVIPVGPVGGYQSLWLITRHGDEFKNFDWGSVSFVPLTRSEQPEPPQRTP